MWAAGTAGHAGAYVGLGNDGELQIYPGPSGGSPLWAAPGILVSGATLASGQSLFAPGGQYTLTMQGDGNLVEYRGAAPVWSSGTSSPGSHALMQGDGNLVRFQLDHRAGLGIEHLGALRYRSSPSATTVS